MTRNCAACGSGFGMDENLWPCADGYRCEVCGPDPAIAQARELLRANQAEDDDLFRRADWKDNLLLGIVIAAVALLFKILSW